VLPKNWASTWSNQFGVLILESFASWEKYVVRDVCVKKGSELGASNSIKMAITAMVVPSSRIGSLGSSHCGEQNEFLSSLPAFFLSMMLTLVSYHFSCSIQNSGYHLQILAIAWD
jgi:hypothetical protein